MNINNMTKKKIDRKELEFVEDLPKDLINNITKKHWYRHGVYKDTLIFATEASRGLKKEFFKLEGIDKGVDDYIQLGAEVYITQEEFDEFVDIMLEKIHNEKNYLKDYIKSYEKDLTEAISKSEELSKIDYSKLDNSELAVKITYYFDEIALLHHWLWSMEFLNEAFDRFLKESVKKWKPEWDYIKIDDFLSQISHISKKLAFQEEQGRILKLSSLDDKGLLEIYDKYKWLNMHLMDGLPYTFEEYKEKANKIFAVKGESLIKLKEQEQMIKNSNQIISSVDDLKLKEVLKTAQELIYIKTYRIDVYTYTAFLTLKLREEIAKRLNLNLEDLNRYILIEIVEALNGNNLSQEELHKRKIYATIKSDDKEYYLKGDLVKGLREILWKEQRDISEIKGTVAYKGNVKGMARVILNNREINQVQKGEILICNLTNPDYNPVFEKITGLVTDEGGVLCHSAIMAREFKIPCIIGTKNATSVIKTGDLIEVDANSGIVRILERKK